MPPKPLINEIQENTVKKSTAYLFMCSYLNICKWAEEGLFKAEFVKIIPLFPLFSFLAKQLQASHQRPSLSLSNFFDSENIGLKHSLCAAHIGMGGVKIEKEPRQ